MSATYLVCYYNFIQILRGKSLATAWQGGIPDLNIAASIYSAVDIMHRASFSGRFR